MEEKLLELFRIATEYAEQSKENYMEIEFDYKEIEINIRNKKSYDYLVNMTLYLSNADIDTFIKKLKLFIEEEKDGQVR